VEVTADAAGLLVMLFPHLAGVRVSRVADTGDAVVIYASADGPQACCPRCGVPSRRVQGRYRRLLADGAAAGRPLLIALTVRRFRCLNPQCPAVTFAEQPAGLAGRRLRRTLPLRALLARVGIALAGRAGARLAGTLGIAVHHATVLRLVMAQPVPEPAAAPRVLGVDDFALRRGHVYGTVLIDAETGQVTDLLPDREAGTLAHWLKEHPGAQVICRDRAGAYAEASREGAPGALQAADRWHLLHNLAEKTREAAAAHRASCLAPPAGPPPRPQQQQQQQQQQDKAGQPAGPAGRLTLAERTRQRHAEVRQLLDAGHRPADIARILGLSRPTVAKFARAATPGEITAAAREQALDPFKPYLISRWNAGTRDAAALHAEIKAQGYQGSGQQVRRFVRPFRDLPAAPPAPPPVPSARKLAAWLMTRPGSLAAQDAAALAAATAACPHLGQLRTAIASFRDMTDGLTATRTLAPWLTAAEASGIDQLASFARGIRRDHDAVLTGLSRPHNSGKVEGTVNKIKMLKRQTYGRASFELLRHRVLLYPQ
jgi:transposase